MNFKLLYLFYPDSSSEIPFENHSKILQNSFYKTYLKFIQTFLQEFLPKFLKRRCLHDISNKSLTMFSQNCFRNNNGISSRGFLKKSIRNPSEIHQKFLHGILEIRPGIPLEIPVKIYSDTSPRISLESDLVIHLDILPGVHKNPFKKILKMPAQIQIFLEFFQKILQSLLQTFSQGFLLKF